MEPLMSTHNIFMKTKGKEFSKYPSYLEMYHKVETLLSQNWGEFDIYGKCPKISNTLKFRTPNIFAQNNFW